MEIKQVNRQPRLEASRSSASRQSGAADGQKPASRIHAFRSLRLHPLAATVATVLVLGLGLAFLIRHRPFYAATSVVYVSPIFPSTMSPDNEHSYPYDSYVDQQAHAVKQYDVLADAIRNLANENPPIVLRQPGESEQLAVERLGKLITASRIGMTYQVEIKMIGSSPRHLAAIANAVTDSYLAKAKNDEFYGQGVRLDALKDARDKIQAQLQSALGEQAQLSQQLGVAVLGSTDSDHLDSQVANLRAALTNAQEARIAAAAQLISIEHGGANNPALNDAADQLIAGDPGLVAMKAALSQKRTELLTKLAGMTPNHPLRKQTEQQLHDIEAALTQMQTRLRTRAATQLEQQLSTKLLSATTVENKLAAELRAATGKASSAAPKFQRADQLAAQIKDLQTRYAELDQRTRNLELESTSPGSVHMYSRARTPLGPEKSKVRKYGFLLIPFALLCGIGTAVAIDYFDPRLYTAGDVEMVLGFPPIGTIFDDQQVTMKAFDECTLRMAAGIDHAARSAGVRTVVVTAVRSGAGTSSMVENLGSTLAKLGRKTLTIDASGNTPPVAYLTVGYTRPAKSETGLTEAGAARSDLETAEVVAQPLSPGAAPLKSFMDEAFTELTKEYELILIDATPLLISAETEYLARFADVTVLVAESGKTRKADLERALAVLERINVRGVAAAVNKVDLARANQETRRDLKDFEAHADRMNLRWRSTPASPAADERVAAKSDRSPEDQERPTYARRR